jgi:hypothetical protein
MVLVLPLISLSLNSVAILCASRNFPHQLDLEFSVIRLRPYLSYSVAEALPASLHYFDTSLYEVSGQTEVGLTWIVSVFPESWTTDLVCFVLLYNRIPAPGKCINK